MRITLKLFFSLPLLIVNVDCEDIRRLFGAVGVPGELSFFDDGLGRVIVGLVVQNIDIGVG